LSFSSLTNSARSGLEDINRPTTIWTWAFPASPQFSGRPVFHRGPDSFDDAGDISVGVTLLHRRFNRRASLMTEYHK
jgi:hypothetical protein